MSEDRNHDCLSFGDALFLHLERAGMPLNVAGVAYFEGDLHLREVMAYIESKLPLLPRYLQRVVMPPFALSAPTWEYDPEFDLRNHVREIRLRHGTDAEVRAIASHLFSSTMDRRRPLWDFTILSGLKGNRTALIPRLHHCLADGISGVGLLKALLSKSPQVEPLPRPKARHRIPPPRDPATLLVEGAVSACFSSVERLLSAHAELLGFARHVAQNGSANGSGHHEEIGFWDELASTLPELAAPPERLPFNVVCRGPQKFYWTDVPLREIKQIKNACGCTVNDVVLGLVSSSIRRYAEERGVSARRRLLRIVVPVSLRGPHDESELGNRITFVPVTIPLGVRRACRLLGDIHRKTALIKKAHLAELVSLAGTALGIIPTALQALLGPLASQLPLAVCNLICTNVPGPQWPLYLLGHRMLTCYPYVPIGGEMGMNVAVLTYDGTAYFGFSGDVHAVPDLGKLPRFLQQSFAEMKKGAGVRLAAARRAKPVEVPRVVQPAAKEEKPVPEVAMAASA